jgi:carbon storage regulator
MLVLSRKIGETITVGNSVNITVLSYDRGVIRLGINAPKSIPIHRKEIHDKIVDNNRKAAKTELLAIKKAIFDNQLFNNSDIKTEISENEITIAIKLQDDEKK